MIEKIVCEKYSFAVTNVSNQLFVRNSLAEFEKLFIWLNEIKGKDKCTDCKTFKQRITDHRRDFEPKGLKAYRLVATCNNKKQLINYILNAFMLKSFKMMKQSNVYLNI